MELEEARRRHPHLRRYLERLRSQGREPRWVEMERSLKQERPYDFIYPVGGPYFIHVREDGGLYPSYRPVQPALEGADDALAAVREEAFALAPRWGAATDPGVIEEGLAQVGRRVARGRAFRRRRSHVDDAIFVLHQEIAEHGLLEPLMRDPWIEDIHGLGTKPLLVVHKIFGMVETDLSFPTTLALDRWLQHMGQRMGRPVSQSSPIVDGALPNGSRINIVYSDEVSKGGSSFTIRKFSETPLPVTQLIAWGTMDARLAAYLWLCLENGMSVFVSGETASGKTTSLNGILPFVHPRSKVLTAEDTPEVLPPQKNWQQLVTREMKEDGSAVEMYDLLKAGLRSRPNLIIVGEIRGAEGAVAFQAMQTGHPTMATFHASSVQKLIQRFTSPPIDVPVEFMGNLNVVLIQMAVHVKGRMLRRVLAVEEIEGFSKRAGKAITRQVFNWDSVRDTIQFGGRNNSYVLENLIASKLHLEDRRAIYRLLDQRTWILEELVRRQLFDYHEFADLMSDFALRGTSALPFEIPAELHIPEAGA